MKPLKRSKKSTVILIIVGILTVAGLVYLIFHGQYLHRRNVIQLQNIINSYGYLSPLVVAFLVFLGTVIPPLPLPTPLVEIAAGAVFGFWEGFLVIWVSQIFSSLFVYYLLKYFNRHFYGKFLKNKFWDSYRQFLNQRGAWAVFILRTTLSAPFNIISFLAGISNMKNSGFVIATIFGTISEALLFGLIGSQLRTIHVSFKYLSIIILFVGIIGFLLTFVGIKFIPHREKKPISS